MVAGNHKGALDVSERSLAARLGLAEDAQIVVPHIDDVGMCHGANLAFRQLAGRGFITCGSVMVPCPWFRETVDMAQADPALDLGVHLTLTSEWRHYRWRPVIGARKASGLVDEEGFMWRTAREVCLHADPSAVEEELRAQVEQAIEAGIDATHLDCHMGTALAPEFVEIYLRLGRDYRLPLLFPRHWEGYGCGLSLGTVDPALHAERVRALEAAGHPIVDRFIGTPWVASAEADAAYAGIVDSIGPGVTFLALHPNASGDIEIIDPPRCHCRTDELRIFQEQGFLERTLRRGLHQVGFRHIREACGDLLDA